MELLRLLKEKLKDGSLRTAWHEFRWLWRYIRRYHFTIIIHILLGVLGILMSLAGSVASKYLLDAVTGYKSGEIGIAAAAMAGMMLGNILMRGVSSRVGAVLNIRVQNEIQSELYGKVLSADWEAVENFSTGDLLNRLNSDANIVSGGVTGFIPSLISGLVQFIGSFAIMTYYDPTMTVIALLSVPVSVLSSKVLIRRMRSYNKEMKAIYSEMMAFQEDSFQNLTSIKAFGITDLFTGQMRSKQKQYRTAFLDYNRFAVRTSILVSLLGMLVSAGCFGWGVYRLWSGAITYGSMVLFIQLSSSISSAFSNLIGMVPSAVSISTSVGRLMEAIQWQEESVKNDQGISPEGRYTLSLSHVSFRYKDGETVLRDVNMVARPGDLIALNGPSGEGKTTMLRIFLGLVRPSEGTAELVGEHGERYPISPSTRTVFGYVPQGNSVFAGTVAENLRMTRPEATDEELWEVLRVACAEEFVRDLPGQLQYQLGGRGKSVSEGQAQRLAVARALLRRAPILLLDEATSALDEDTEARMLDNLMNSGMVHTCILVTHRPGSRRICTRSYQLWAGEVTEEMAAQL